MPPVNGAQSTNTGSSVQNLQNLLERARQNDEFELQEGGQNRQQEDVSQSRNTSATRRSATTEDSSRRQTTPSATRSDLEQAARQASSPPQENSDQSTTRSNEIENEPTIENRVRAQRGQEVFEQIQQQNSTNNPVNSAVTAIGNNVNQIV